MKKIMYALLLVFLFPLFAENDDETLRVGISLGYPVLHFSENGAREGLEIELAKGFADYLGKSIVFVPLSIHDISEAIKDKRIDIAFAGYSRSIERGKKVWFSDPYLEISPAALVHERAVPRTSYGSEFETKKFKTVSDLAQLPRLRVLLKKDSVYESSAPIQYPMFDISAVASIEEGLSELLSGKGDALLHDSLYLEYLYQRRAELQGRFLLLKENSREHISAVLPRGEEKLLYEVNFFLSELKRTGQIQRWLEEYSKK